MSLRPLAFSLFPLLLLSLARADDANWSTIGGAGAFTPNRQVRMEREDVRIRLDDRTMRVHATFWFRNQGPATTVRMGFPDETRLWPETKHGAIRRFRSSVDGKPVRVRHERMNPGIEPRFGVENYRSAWVKRVVFPKDGARRVEVWYDAGRGDVTGGTFDAYVFKTGATWRGTIGRIETTVDWSRSRTLSRPALRLTGPAAGARWTRLGPRRTRLVVENVKPRFNLDLSSIEGFWNVSLNGRHLPLRAGWSDFGPVVAGTPWDLRVSIKEIGALFDERERPGAKDADDTVWHAAEARRFGGRLNPRNRRRAQTPPGPRRDRREGEAVHREDAQGRGGRLRSSPRRVRRLGRTLSLPSRRRPGRPAAAVQGLPCHARPSALRSPFAS